MPQSQQPCDPPSKALTLDNLIHLLYLNASTRNNPGEPQINLWMPPTVSDARTLPNPLSKRSCHSVNTTLLPINATNNRHPHQALIATPRFAAAKSPNQSHALLITRQIVQMPLHINPCRVSPTNPDNLSAFINARMKKGYIRLTTRFQKNWKRISRTAKPTTQTSRTTNCKSTSWR